MIPQSLLKNIAQKLNEQIKKRHGFILGKAYLTRINRDQRSLSTMSVSPSRSKTWQQSAPTLKSESTTRFPPT